MSRLPFACCSSWILFFTKAGICICRRQTTHSPERKERNTPMKVSAPFMSEKTSKGALPPDDYLNLSDFLSKAYQDTKQEGKGAVLSSVTRCPNNVTRCYQMFLKDLSDGPAPCQQLVFLQRTLLQVFPPFWKGWRQQRLSSPFS